MHTSTMSTTKTSTHPSPSTSSTVARSALTAVPDLDPHAFEMFQIWLHTGLVPTRYQACRSSVQTNSDYVWQDCWPLFNAHILGSEINAPAFSDRVMDVLQDRIGRTVHADIDTINHIFAHDRPAISMVLKQFIVDRYIEAATENRYDKLNLERLPQPFVQLMLHSALLRLSSSRPASASLICRYHMHEDPTSCYKKLANPTQAHKQQRLQLQREMSRKDSEEVVTNAKLNGIKTVDWETRRAETELLLRQRRSMDKTTMNRSVDEASTWPEATQGPALRELHRDTGTAIVTSQADAMTDTRTGYLFGTAQMSGGAIDDALGRLPVTTTITTEHDNIKTTRNGANEPSSKPCTVHESIFPSPSRCSLLSRPDSELRRDIEIALECERHSGCPGAFPLSRNGSVVNFDM